MAHQELKMENAKSDPSVMDKGLDKLSTANTKFECFICGKLLDEPTHCGEYACCGCCGGSPTPGYPTSYSK